MDEAQIAELSKTGLVEIQPHGHSHGILRDMKREDAIGDIRRSKRIVESLTGMPAACFAYPYGKYSDETPKILKELGFQSAVTVKEGIVASETDLLELPRMNIGADASLSEFKCKVAKPRSYLALKRLAQKIKI
jgi:peptidoglycan/xylan/chitin deacetylase (PgdA/CDA1 family)